MSRKYIAILVVLAMAIPFRSSHAGQSADEQAQTKQTQSKQQQDSRYLVYVSGIT